MSMHCTITLFHYNDVTMKLQVKRVDAAEAVAVYQQETGFGKPAVKHDDHGHGHGHGKYFYQCLRSNQKKKQSEGGGVIKIEYLFVDHGHAKEVHHHEPTAVFVDVRSAADAKNFVFKGFMHVPLSELNEKMSTIPTGKDIYLMDTTGLFSEQAAELLSRSGYNSVNVIDGTYHRCAVSRESVLMWFVQVVCSDG